MKYFLVADSGVLRDRLIALLSTIECLQLCGVADNESESARAIAERCPDMVFLDMSLKKSDWRSVLQAIASSGRIIILLLQSDRNDFRIEGWKRGAAYCFDLATEMHEFISVVSRLAAGMREDKGGNIA